MSSAGKVIACPYTTMDEFISVWNNLNGRYDRVYILGHGQEGSFNARGGQLTADNPKYNYSMLRDVDVDKIYLYICNGDTWPENGTSTAYSFAKLTGATVYAVRDGKLNFTWFKCYPYMHILHIGELTATKVD